MEEKKIKKRVRVKKDLEYYKNLKKDIEKQIKILATKESVKKRKELYKKRAIIGKYMLDLFELEDENIDNKTLEVIFEDFISSLNEEEKSLFIDIDNDSNNKKISLEINENKNYDDDDDY